MSTRTASTHLSTPRAERTRSTILRAAGQLFGNHGYTHVTMDEIAAEAAVTKPTVYAHFGSKEALFETLIGSVISPANLGGLPPAQTIEEVAAALFEWSRNHLDWLLSDATVGLMRAASAEGLRRPDWAHNLLAGFDFGAMERWLADLDEAGVLEVGSPSTAATFLTALTKGTLFYPVMVAGQPIATKEERDELIREAVRVFLKAYAPSSGKPPAG